MKTITEFAGISIKFATKIKQELTSAGKTPEEIPQALGESLKIEGDKLNHTINALELVGSKLNDLKRVVVMSLAEGEKAPSGAQQKGEHYYLIEYYPPLAKPGRGPKDKGGPRGDRGRGGKRGGKGRGKGGRDGRGGDRGPGKGPRGDRGSRGGDRGSREGGGGSAPPSA